MEKPAKLAFSEEATFTLLRGEILIFLVIVGFGFMLALATSNASLSDLILPFAAMSAIGFFWVGLLGAIAWGHRIGEKRSISRLFNGEIWECWQFNAAEWQAIVEAESDLISPKDEGLEAYLGAVYSSIFGAVLAIIIVAVGIFATDDPGTKTALWIGAAAVFLLLVGIGLFQPLIARYQAYRYSRKALSVPEPRVWFSANGFYHEALGHISLKDLENVTDQTRSRKAIQFTLTISTDTSDSSVAYPCPVPAGCEDRAGILVRRYRQERIPS